MKTLLTIFLLLLSSSLLLADEQPTFTAAQLEHFEKQIRPILVEHCYSCHQGEKFKGGLLLHSRAAILKGGDSGPAAISGNAAESELIKAVNYEPDGYQMPPKGKLSPEQIKLLTAWVQEGLPWPVETKANTGGVDPEVAWKKRQEHWSLQPLLDPAKNPVPKNDGLHKNWATQPFDQFILDKLLAKQLTPAMPVNRNVLIRRLKYDLLGLPPTPEEINQFCQDTSSDAYEKLVDRYLASPHYGERYGRHWLDLMRYAESLGHEFDFNIDEVWRYRDYVIKAFNEDVPYNQFVTEHLAGDLLINPRTDPVTKMNESVLGTGFLWMSQGKHSPVDIKAEECDLIDNQIDVLTKSFLATSVACARCHDHKFDAITASDYYALSGYLKSACRNFVNLNQEAGLSELQNLQKIEQEQFKTNKLQKISSSLMQEKLPPGEFLDQLIRELGSEKNNWLTLKTNHPLHFYAELKQLTNNVGFTQAAKLILEKYSPAIKSSAAVETPLTQWVTSGNAFSHSSQGLLNNGEQGYELISEKTLHSSNISQLVGTARTPTFRIDQPFLLIQANRKSGTQYLDHPRFGKHLKTGQIHLVIEGFQHIKEPLYGELSFKVNESATPQWHKINLSIWVGCRAYVEVEDTDGGWIRIDQLKFSAQPDTPTNYCDQCLAPLLDNSVQSIDDYAARLKGDIQQSWDKFINNHSVNDYGIDLVNAVLKLNSTQQKLKELENQQPDNTSDVALKIKQQLEAIKAPAFGLTTCELSSWDDTVLIRGNPNKPGEIEPRRFLSSFENQLVIDQQESLRLFQENQSRRHELAMKITHRNNSLFARVIVNRLWKHHFGQGLVSTLDDFGHMGQAPSHPELLDYLAHWFIEHDYSMKELSRMLVTSSTYQQSSDLVAQAQEVDPQNLLYHRMHLRRLEAEIIRDALIHVTNDLNEELYGASIPVHLTTHMQGRGRPQKSGPVDGANRRSIYTEVRRNFITPFFLAFDYPLPMSTTGKRSISNVPAQSLALKNNPLVHQQAEHLAEITLLNDQDSAAKLQVLFQRLFSRSPTDNELQILLEFIQQSQADPKTTWVNVCHLLFNMKEFIYIP